MLDIVNRAPVWPQTWDAALAMMAEAMADRFDHIAGVHRDAVANMNTRIDDLTALNRRMLDERAEDAATLADLRTAIDARDETIVALRSELAVNAADLTSQATVVTGFEALAERYRDDSRKEALIANEAATGASGRAEAAIAGQEAIRELVTVLVNRLHGVDARVGETEGRVSAIGAAQLTTRELVDAHGDRLEANANAVSLAFERCETSVHGLAAIRGEFERHACEVSGQVAAMGDASDAIADHSRVIAAVQESVTVAIRQLPSSFVQNRDGRLIMITGHGEQIDLGQMAGRDGKDAPVIVDTIREGGSVHLIFNDGSKTSFGLPPASAIIPKASPVHDVAGMIATREDGKTFAQIGKKYGISAQHAARLIKKGL